MNEILNANLNAIKRYNENLVSQILSIKSLQNNISLCETELKEHNLTYNGMPIHSQKGAEAEAQSIFNNTEDSPNYIHVIYGLGLGYLFKEFCDKSCGTTLLYEPDLEILRVTLEIVDFSKELSKGTIYVTSDFDSLEKIFPDAYSYGSNVKCHFLDFHRNTRSEDIQNLTKELTRINSIYSSNYNFQNKENYNFLKSATSAFKDKAEATPFRLLKDICKDVPAIVVSAGPSLNKNIEILKENQDKVLIFCVGTAYKALAKHGIKPDFLNAIEMGDAATQFNEYNLENINFISEGYTHRNFHRIKYKRKFLTLSHENISNVWFGSVTEHDVTGYETKGTVSYNALNCAQIMGCNPIILIGQDLAYTDGECYSKDAAYGTLKCIIDPETNSPKILPEDLEKYRISIFGEDSVYPSHGQYDYITGRLNQLNSSLMLVKGQNKEMIATEQGYALFVEYFKDFAKRNKDSILLINSSTGGAQIDGFYNLPLSEVMNQLQYKKPNIDKILDEIDYKPDFSTIMNNLNNEVDLISDILTTIKRGQIDLKNFKREIQRAKSLNQTASKYLKNCLNSFIKIINDYKEQSPIVSAVTRNEESNLGFVLKEKDGKYDYNTQLEIIKGLEEYFYNGEKKFTEIQGLLKNIVAQIRSEVHMLV